MSHSCLNPLSHYWNHLAKNLLLFKFNFPPFSTDTKWMNLARKDLQIMLPVLILNLWAQISAWLLGLFSNHTFYSLALWGDYLIHSLSSNLQNLLHFLPAQLMTASHFTEETEAIRKIVHNLSLHYYSPISLCAHIQCPLSYYWE